MQLSGKFLRCAANCTLLLLAGACGTAPVHSEDSGLFEPRLERVRRDADKVFALSSTDDVRGISVYLAHKEPVVRHLAHRSLLAALHFGHEEADLPQYDAFQPYGEIKEAYRRWARWLETGVDLKDVLRARPRARSKKAEERLLLESVVLAVNRLGSPKDMDLLAELLESEDEYVRRVALRRLREAAGGPGEDEAAASGLAPEKAWLDWWRGKRSGKAVKQHSTEEGK
jgi:hypothetical protein